jgi:hypothetical protein
MGKTSAAKSLTRAEIQRRYRERKKAENNDVYLQKERERWYQRRDKKTVKVIDDCTEREKRIIRRKWRERMMKHRAQKKREESYTPPPERESQISRGRKLLRRRKTESYRMIAKLKCLLAQQSRARERYRKQLQRLQNIRKKHALRSVPPDGSSHSRGPNPTTVTPMSTVTPIPLHQLTPKSKTRMMLKNTDVPSPVQKTLLLHHTLVAELNETRHKLTTEKEKRFASNLVRGKILKKIRC